MEKRVKQLKDIQNSAKEFKKQYPKISEAIKLYNATSDIRKQSQIANSYKTTTSTSLSTVFTSR